MTWRGPRTQSDPLLHTQWWRVTVRNHFKRLRLPCAVCRGPIDYDGPAFFVLANGKRRQNPRSLVIGHIVSRYEAKRRGWSEQQINALANCRQECRRCSNRSGAQQGQRVRSKRQAVRTVVPSESRRW